jgi:putative resolvase
MFVPLRQAAKHYSVSKQTISAWASRGDIEYTTLPGGHRRFRLVGNGNLLGVVVSPAVDAQEKIDICYCRVSSAGQKDDLERQIAYMRAEYPGWEIYSDVGSGLNWKRKGLRTVLRRCLSGDVRSVAVAHRDRLARFGYEILEYVMGQCEVKLLCDDAAAGAGVSREAELVEDILSIVTVTVFSARLHGQRHYKARPKDRPAAAAKRLRETSEVDGLLSVDVQRGVGVDQERRVPQEDILLAA